VIRKDDGTDFISATEREEFISSYFEKIYQPPAGELPLTERVVEEFLGNEICNNPVVINSKLRQDETEFFES
jgi:hypothetical protein